MTYEEIHEMMQETGLPFAYHHFAEGESPQPPFLLFLPVSMHSVRIIRCITASNSWTLNYTRIRNHRK